jgi:hypothetical protein
VKIAPALPNPHQPRTHEGSATPPQGRPPEAVDEPAAGRPPVPRVDGTARAAPITREQILMTRQAEHSLQAFRALASYNRVAGDGEHDALREMLGFDAYA